MTMAWFPPGHFKDFYLESAEQQLIALKTQLPSVCNLANTRLLQQLFADYKFVVYGLGENFVDIKNHCDAVSYRLRSAIDSIDDRGNAWSRKKMLFDTACKEIATELDFTLVQLAAIKK